MTIDRASADLTRHVRQELTRCSAGALMPCTLEIELDRAHRQHRLRRCAQACRAVAAGALRLALASLARRLQPSPLAPIHAGWTVKPPEEALRRWEARRIGAAAAGCTAISDPACGSAVKPPTDVSAWHDRAGRMPARERTQFVYQFGR